MITKVNSDKDIKQLLDDGGQLKLRTPFNMFIGGQILDRGITISNLIGFYYGRNPNRFQQDTVLQHSRMYGARPTADLAVTQFFAPQHVYQVMKRSMNSTPRSGRLSSPVRMTEGCISSRRTRLIG